MQSPKNVTNCLTEKKIETPSINGQLKFSGFFCYVLVYVPCMRCYTTFSVSLILKLLTELIA